MVSEPARHALYARLQEVLGGEHAETFMASLPPYPLSEVATKSDLGRLEGRFDRLEERFDRMEDRFDRMEDRFDSLTRTFITTTVGAMTALTAIFGLMMAVFS